MKTIFLGPPGAGKGTIAQSMAKKFAVVHISSGQLFRDAIKAQTEIGRQVQKVLASGALVEDSLTIALVRERLLQDDCSAGFILDGFPRTVAQAQALSTIVTVDTALLFDVPDSILVDRLSGRRICPQCGRTYHTLFAQPKVASQCDLCRVALETRPDDTKEAVLRRLETYHAQTEPVISFYRDQHLLTQIDGSPAIDTVIESATAVFNQYQ